METENRKEFAGAHFWLRSILELVGEGFKGYSQTVEGFNAAKSWFLRNAFKGAAPDFHINPAWMKVSYGDLPLSSDIAVAKTADGQSQFTWNPADVEGGYSKDQVMMLPYDTEHADPYYTTAGQFRSAGAGILEINTVS